MTSPSNAAASSTTATAQPVEISRDEAELYDRQIRLWGLEAQNRLRNSSVLLVGLSGLGAEVAKNLMLAGIKSLTIMDEKPVIEWDFASQFLITPDLLSQNRAAASKHKIQVLNPMVELIVSEKRVEAVPADFFNQFSLVILIDQTYDVVNKVNKICRAKGIRFHAGGVYGWMGFAFFDCNNHTFLLPKPKVHTTTELADSDDEGCSALKRAASDAPPPAVVTTIEDDEEQKIAQAVPFHSFEHAFNIRWDAKQMSKRARSAIPSSYFPIRALLRIGNERVDYTADDVMATYKTELAAAQLDGDAKHSLSVEDTAFLVGPQLSPVCAIVGSLIGQEAIKALSQNDVPLKNVFIYSALETSGIICDLPPKGR